MKRFAIIVMAFAAMLFVTTNFAEAQNKKNAKKEVQVTFSIPDVDCQHCVNKIESKMPYEKGVKDMKVSLDNKTIWISYEDSKTNKENLAKALEKLGYPAKEVEQK